MHIEERGIKKVDISAVGGPCLAAGLANRVHSSVVIANKDIRTAKKIADMLNNNYYHTSFSDDLNGVEVSAAIKNISNEVAGKADILLVPNLETGNALSKIMVYFMGACAAGFIVGGKVPVVVTSRADSSASRIASIAASVIAAK